VSASSLRISRRPRFGEDGQKAGASRRLQHDILGVMAAAVRAASPSGHRRGELLQRLAFLGAAGLAGQEACNLRQRGQARRRRVGLAEDGRSELPQEEDRRGLAGLISGLPVPEAGSIGAPKAVSMIPRAALESTRCPRLERGQQQPCGGQNGRKQGDGRLRRRRRGKTVHREPSRARNGLSPGQRSLNRRD
jgi:hypothetical protein